MFRITWNHMVYYIYLQQLINAGWTDNNGLWMPDWNSDYFIERARKLIHTIGAQYNGDPRIAWIDMGMYGKYGEW